MQTRRRKLSEAEPADNSKVVENVDISKVVAKKTPKKQKTTALVASILDEIKEENAVAKSATANGVANGAAKESLPKEKPLKKTIRGQPKSGRPWKDVKQKFSTIKKSLNRRTFARKELLREELKHIKELSSSVKEEKKQENVAKKQRRLENAQRRLENERKNEVVQVIKNTAKMKRMKKKALRKIEKRDLTSANGPKVV